jgi:hypothetical protein
VVGDVSVLGLIWVEWRSEEKSKKSGGGVY